jgi:hypothetical protein
MAAMVCALWVANIGYKASVAASILRAQAR